ncbi:MAG: hypothetical protein ACFBZ8_08185 [Opitutales bacterium]
MSSNHPKPIVLSWATCDGVHIDPATGKFYLLGIFSGIRAQNFPAAHPRMFWFLLLTELTEGDHQLKISMGLPTEPPQTVVDRPFKAQGPLQRVHLVNEVKNLQFPKPENYSLVIEVDNELLLATNFPVAG